MIKFFIDFHENHLDFFNNPVHVLEKETVHGKRKYILKLKTLKNKKF